MRKLLISLTILFFSATTALAQSDIFNHLAIGAGVGTQGISVDLATTLTKYAAVRAGVNFMPNFSVKDHFSGTYSGVRADYQAKAEFARTTFEIDVDFYPVSNLFITAGLSFGGEKVGKIKGEVTTSTAVPAEYLNDSRVNIGEYSVPVKDGKVDAAIEVHKVRPYFGIGYGRAVPKGRVACRIELGVQLHGKPVPTSPYGPVVKTGVEADDDISKVVNKLTVYPVLKFRIAGRIL